MHHTLAITLITLGLATTPFTVQAGQVILNPVLGVQQNDTEQITVNSNVITFKNDGDTGVLGFQGGYLFDFGLALTGEILLSKIEFENETAGSRRGEINMGSLTSQATYYFNQDQRFQPYIGIGLGSMGAEIDNSNTNIDMEGYRSEGKVGFLVQFNDTMGLTVEYKCTYFSLEDEDNDNNTYKSRGNYLGAGFSIRL